MTPGWDVCYANRFSGYWRFAYVGIRNRLYRARHNVGRGLVL